MGGYGQNSIVVKDSWNFQHLNAGLDIDLLFDIIKPNKDFSLSLFGGIIGGGEVLFSKATTDEEGSRIPNISWTNLFIKGKVGLSFRLVEHHRLEFSALIPIYNYALNDFKVYYKPYTFLLSYKFLF
ncbi:outer membrane protein [Helicobacter mustelae]|nr:outer membrane protein [Helicobacter mustelae]